jgi:SPP1 gp7 family putative phage head morphogenesis protein
MSEVITYKSVSVATYNSYDPTRTTVLRNLFSKAMNKRFDELVSVVKKAIIDQDCFGLNKEKIQTHQMSVPGQGAFAFTRSSDKVEAFMKWLQQQIDKGILEVTTFQQAGYSVESAWTNLYILDSYKRGVIRARYELKKAGYDVPSMEQTGGIAMSMSTPFHMDRVGLLFTRVFSDLKGITSAMDAQISRVLAQGMADGDGMMLLARKMVATINGTGMGDLGITDTLGRFIPAARRAEMLARTEIIRSFHQATIQEYRNWAVEGVQVQAEWSTAGDDRVCDLCSEMEGKIFSLDEIENMIPVHPLCRCISVPYLKELEKFYNK